MRDAALLLDQLAELYPAPSAPEDLVVPTTFTASPAPAEVRAPGRGRGWPSVRAQANCRAR